MASIEQNKKKEHLENFLKELGSAAVAFSGGFYIFTESCT